MGRLVREPLIIRYLPNMRYAACSSGSERERAAVLRWSAAVRERGLIFVCLGGTRGKGATFTANFSIFKPEITQASAMMAFW